MQDPQGAQPPFYNPRWFIWAIVFLVVSGISLVSYIMISGSGIEDDQQPVFGVIHRVPSKR